MNRLMAILTKPKSCMYPSYWETALNWGTAADISKKLLIQHVQETLHINAPISIDIDSLPGDHFISLQLTINNNWLDTYTALLWINGGVELKSS